MLAICINYRKSLFFIFACRNGKIFVPLHSSNQRSCEVLRTFSLGNQRNNSIEGQDENCFEDFPSAKVQSRCLQTKSPLLLRSNPIMNPMPNGRLMGENDSARGKHLFLFYYFAKQTKQNPSMNSSQESVICQSVKLSRGYFPAQPQIIRQKKACRKPTGFLSYDYPRYFIRIFALPESRSFVIDFSRI